MRLNLAGGLLAALIIVGNGDRRQNDSESRGRGVPAIYHKHRNLSGRSSRC